MCYCFGISFIGGELVIDINLLPSPKTSLRYAVYFSLLVFSLTIIWKIFLITVNDDYPQELAPSDFQLKMTANQLFADLNNLKDSYDQLEQKLEILDQVSFQELILNLYQIVAELSHEVYLTKIRTAQGKIFFIGQSSSYHQISNWLAAIQKIPSIAEVFLEKWSGQEMIQFTIWVDIGGRER